jgi:hypothetical protein
VNSPPVVRRKLGSSLFAGGVAVVCSWLLTIVFGGLAWWLLGGDVAFTIVIALACLATLPLASRIARRVSGASAVRTTSCVLVAWSPYLFGGAAFQLGIPIVQAHWRCGTGDVGLFFAAALSLPIVFGTALAVGVVVDRLRFVLTTKAVAWLTVGLSVLVLAASLRRVHDVVPDGYLASLPVVASMTKDHEDPRFCPLWRATWTAAERGTSADGHEPSCEGVRVLEDAAHGLVIFQMPAQDGSPMSYAIKVGRSGLSEITVRSVASSLRPPTAWAVSQAVGTAIGLLLVVVAFVTRRRAGAWRTAKTGAHGGEGWVTFEDGTPPTHFAGVAALPAGQVLILSSSRGAPHYREHGGIEEGARFVAGTVDDVVQTAETRATDLHAVAILVGLLTLAPMLAAAVDGLLG